MQWIYDNIRYNANAKINNWNFHVDMQLDCKDPRTIMFLNTYEKIRLGLSRQLL